MKALYTLISVLAFSFIFSTAASAQPGMRHPRGSGVIMAHTEGDFHIKNRTESVGKDESITVHGNRNTANNVRIATGDVNGDGFKSSGNRSLGNRNIAVDPSDPTGNPVRRKSSVPGSSTVSQNISVGAGMTESVGLKQTVNRPSLIGAGNGCYYCASISTSNQKPLVQGNMIGTNIRTKSRQKIGPNIHDN